MFVQPARKSIAQDRVRNCNDKHAILTISSYIPYNNYLSYINEKMTGDNLPQGHGTRHGRHDEQTYLRFLFIHDTRATLELVSQYTAVY